MKIPSYRRLFKNDYPEDQQNLVDKMASSINIAIEVLNDALNRNLNLTDNLAVSIKDVTVKVDGNGIPIQRTVFPVDLPTQVMGLQVIRAENSDNSSIYPTSGVFINFTQSNQNIVINHITGLVANNNYQIKVIAWHN